MGELCGKCVLWPASSGLWGNCVGVVFAVFYRGVAV